MYMNTFIFLLQFPSRHPFYPMRYPHCGAFDITFSFWVISASAPSLGAYPACKSAGVADGEIQIFHGLRR